nr:Z1 domain-containing protein [Nitrosomonas nitrosa]
MSVTADRLVDSVIGALTLEPPPTEKEIEDRLTRIANALDASETVREEARRILHASFKLRMELGITLTAADEHEPWIGKRAADFDAFYWSRYRRYMQRNGRGPLVVNALDRTTDELLDLLGNPTTDGPWKRRGLVVGDVQSGKTATYAALIAKAADAGYRMIILLTGTLENVRRQTQERMDEAFVGLDSREYLTGSRVRRKVHVGVGLIDSARDGIVFTSQDHDFRKNAATSLGISLRSVREPVLVVSKKNKGVLTRLAAWLRARNAAGDERIDLPMLMIDDEADNASINTNKSGTTTQINAAIRDLLSIFTRSSYVGFTATPFANIFIDPRTTDDMLGDDLFPRDFIHVLEPPSNYIGMDRLFPPRDADDEDEDEAVLREIDDHDDWLPLRHEISDVPGPLPESLSKALSCFLIATAIRDVRFARNDPGKGGDEHRTMLVNASRFTSVQNLIADQLQEELDHTRDAVRMHGKLEPARAEAQSPRIKALGDVFREEYASSGVSWAEVLDVLHEAMSVMRVQAVNQSTRKQKLDYKAVKGPPGVRVIVVGGNSLSRGLTLEGLTISYFLRNSRAYDTLLQMGRWFGYREGFDDLCRLWMTDDARGWYRHITNATVELKTDFAAMKRRRATPMEFGLRVRTHPDTLLITARNKMRSGRDVDEVWDVSLDGRMVETTRLFADRGRNQGNMEEVEAFISRLGAGAASPHRGAQVWPGVSAEVVADLLYERFAVHPFNFDFQGDSIADFLREAAAAGQRQFDNWIIALPVAGEALDDKGAPAVVRLPHGVEAIATLRKVKKSDQSLLVSGKSSRVGGRSDLRHAFSVDEWREINRDGLSEAEIRRRMKAPLMVLYLLQGQQKGGEAWNDRQVLPALALHFPGEESSGQRRLVRYRLNRIAQEQLLGMGLDDDDEEDGEDVVGDDDDDAN